METKFFLNQIFRDFFESFNGFIEIRIIDQNKSSLRQYFYPNIDEIPLNQLISERRNIYFGVAPRKKKSGKEEDAEHVTCLWADLDTPEAQENLNSFPIKPSIIVNSGHGLHAYWLLRNPVKATKEIKDTLKGLQNTLRADHTHDLCRVMRLPGTWNMKDDKEPVQSKIIKMEDIRHDIKDFYQFKSNIKPSNDVAQASKPYTIVPVDLQKFSLPQKCITMIENGNEGTFPSRSEADYYVINSLVEAKATDNEIYSIFNNPHYKISEKVLEKGKYADDYLRLTISKVRVKHSTKQKSIENISAEINIIRLAEKMPAFEKRQKISSLIINHLQKIGTFYRTLTDYYFFNNKTKQLLNIESDEFNALLNRCSSLNPTEIEFRFVKEEIKALIVSENRLVEIHRFAYYNKASFCLYIYNNAQQIYKLNGHSIELVDNGTDEVLFFDDNYADPINIKRNPNNENLVETLVVNRVNFSHGNGISLSPDEQRILLKIYLYTPFFQSIIQSRPILAFIGPKGSGKSHLCRSIGKVLIGAKFDVNPISTDEAYYTVVTNNTLAAFDNVDGKISWLNDALAITATGGYLEKRELYTTNRNVKFKLEAIIMINSRNPHFKRDDVADRLIILKLDRFEHFESGERLIRDLVDHRDQIWNELLHNLNRIVKIFRDNHTRLSTPFRMAEWAEIGLKIAKCFGQDEMFLTILKKMSLTQSHFTLEDDVLWEGLQKWIPKNRGREVTASALYHELADLVGKDRWRFHYKSPIALGKRLKNVVSNLSDFYQVEVRRGHKSQNYYAFDAKENEGKKAPEEMEEVEEIPFLGISSNET